MELTLANLPAAAGAARLTHYRIDGTHSNAFTEWKRLGSPAQPSDAQYAQLKAAGELGVLGEPATPVELAHGAATVVFELPRSAVSLLVLDL